MPSTKGKTPETKPFAAAMTQAQQAADEFSRLFAKMPKPAAPDLEGLLAVQKRNLDALSEANRIALEGAQAVARRHMEIMQQTMVELSETMRALAAAEGPGEKAATQAELLKKAYERAVANTREMSDLIQHAGSDAIEQLNRRIVEAMDEIKALVVKSGGKA
jgi:phasin family protein